MLPYVLACLCCLAIAVGIELDIPTENELFENACRLKNNTLFKLFKENVTSRRRINNVTNSVQPRWISGTFGASKELVPYDDCGSNRSAEEVTWCLHIWHPRLPIEVCLNGTGLYSISPLAHELGIANDVEYIKFCKSRDGVRGCLKIKYIRLFHFRAYISSTVNNAHCISQKFHQIFRVKTVDTLPWMVAPYPANVRYGVVGEKLILECQFAGIDIFTTWSSKNGSALIPLQENPNCTLESNSSSCNRFNTPEIKMARSQRVRAYNQFSDIESCITSGTLRRNYVYLVIDHLEPDDEGSYTCFAKTSKGMSNYSVEVIPEFPVYKPVVIDPEPSVFRVKEDVDFLRLTCQVESGINTNVYWKLPNGEIPKTSYLSDNESCDSECEEGRSVVIGRNSSGNDEFKRVFYRELLLRPSWNGSDISGLYKCVIVYGSAGSGMHQEEVEKTVIVNVATTTNAGPSTTPSTIPTFGSSELLIISSVTPPPLDPIGRSTRDVISHEAFIVLIVFGAVIIVAILVTGGLIIVNRCQMFNMKLDMMKRNSGVRRQGSGLFRDTKEKSVFKLPITVVNTLFFLENKEIPRDKITYISRIDEGTFGQVMKASLECGRGKGEEEEVVAVKLVKDNPRPDDVMNIREELDVMRRLAPHQNIINLWGYCTSPDGPLCIVMEFAPYGNLRDFLRTISPYSPLHTSVTHAAHFRLHATNSNSSSCCSSGCPLLHSPTAAGHTPLSPQPSDLSTTSYMQCGTPPCHSPVVTTHSGSMSTSSGDASNSPAHNWVWSPFSGSTIKGPPFEDFAIQIASGLEHLYNMNVVHCDLAARNILVAQNLTLKIADYGMAKVLGHKNYHRRSPKERIPVKWTAPEALESWVYTHKSDVWSYGVLLWELFTYGDMPYQDIGNHSAMDLMIGYLKEGNRLPHPENCPQHIYDVMKSCWTLSPEGRPNARNIVSQLKCQEC